ncbi:early endosome antigen 1-like [Gambusia affinis]|uniref:early endosome antigen 1-like n=1 Tax=Gambusia affinis TaxID=33528 RepID=UPI001CDBB406|nr:early endosome antigen 1-like [Gambusia affinis]
MSTVTPHALNEDVVRQLSKDELAFVVLDWLQRMKDIGAMLRREDELEKQLTEAQEEIKHLKQDVVSLTEERDSALFQKKMLEKRTIPQLNRELENQRNHKNQFRSEIQKYHLKVMELYTTFKSLERQSKQKVESILIQTDAVESRSTADQNTIEKRDDKVKRLEFELSQRDDDICIFKKEASDHKERCRRLEGKIEDLQKQLEKGEEEMKNILKKLPKPRKEELIAKSRQEFKATLQLYEPIITEEKLRRQGLMNHLQKKESEIKGLLKKQAESNSELSALQRKVAAMNVNEKRCFDRPESEWRKLQGEIQSLNGQVGALIESRDLDRERIKKLNEQIEKWKTKYYTEKKKEDDLQKKCKDWQKECEDLKKSKQSKEAQVKNDIDVETPKTEGKVEMKTDRQVKFLPPIDRKTVRLQTLPLGEGKLVPNFKEDKLPTTEKVVLCREIRPSNLSGGSEEEEHVFPVFLGEKCF